MNEKTGKETKATRQAVIKILTVSKRVDAVNKSFKGKNRT